MKAQPLLKSIFSVAFITMLASCASAPAPTNENKPVVANIQETPSPCWKRESCRANSYPENEWYLGFAEDTLNFKTNAAEYRNMLEQQARGKIAESIRMDVSSRTEMETKSEFKSGGGLNSETINRIFAETIKVNAGAELVNTFTDSYQDANRKKIYAFAAVKKSDLAAYYAQIIELNLSETMHNIALAKQLIELGKKNEAFTKLSEAKKNVEYTLQYRALLLIVDAKTGLERSQNERANELLKEITEVKANAAAVSAKVVFIAGTDIIVPGLQTILHDNDIRITENQEEADYILKIDANVCNLKSNNGIHYANACVNVILTNAKTNVNEVVASITGPKEGGSSAENVGEKAFRSAVSDVWNKVKDKILGNL